MAPQPTALLFVNVLFRTSHWTLMLLSAPPLEQRFAAERVADDVDGAVLVLGEGADRAAAEIRAVGVAAVVEELRVDGLELAALDVDGPSAIDPSVPAPRHVRCAGGLMRDVVAVREGDVLYHYLRIRLVDAVIG